MGEENEKAESAYNEAQAQLYRLGGLWNDTIIYSKGGRLDGWRWVLDAAWRELFTDADADQRKERVRLLKRITPLMPAAKMSSDRCSPEQALILNRAKTMLYFELEDYNNFLRTLAESTGKGGKKVSEVDAEFQ